MDTRRLFRISATALVAAGLLISGCSAGGTPSEASASDTASGTAPGPASVAPGALKKYYGQKLDWHGCGVPDFQCATMKAPLDYARPEGPEIKLAVSRKKATGHGRRLGTLLVNPGGPGGSAIGYLQNYAAIGYPAPVRDRYDMAAIDPRGVARSEPVTCLSGKEMDAYTQVDQTPDSSTETGLLEKSFRKFAKGCQTRSSTVLPHVSTVETARDMDIFRETLGDKKLSYVGASYGTFLGATYAELFPHRTGRLVLDGAMDPSLPARQLNRDQTVGFETAFRSFAADCVKQTDCPLGRKSAADVSARMKAFFTTLDKRPVPTGESRRLGESLATTGVIEAMYDDSVWPQLREAIADAKAGNGAQLLSLADTYYDRESNGSYSNLMFANFAVNCLDLPAAFATPAQVEADLPSFEKASPVFGEGFAWASLNCAYWPAEATGTPHRIEAKGAAPIVVVGTVRDPATPYKWARSLAAQLSSGTLLTYDGDGHTAYGRGSDCVDTAINTYLIEGTPPADGKKCS